MKESSHHLILLAHMIPSAIDTKRVEQGVAAVMVTAGDAARRIRKGEAADLDLSNPMIEGFTRDEQLVAGLIMINELFSSAELGELYGSDV